ncbi:hypothetical protein VPH35_132092 [Triticum aestivum]|uniref:uncharacterized protein isoform X2 n=1 Tax=Triticum aestivum TaxID=4565 RepID=UPI001D024733|nr:uncharacterized protein LOC123159447 isoform X2 [Triticum aestivum]XP_044433222.1 uncharacterized protein LOC123159447 isoform X2 [Triticum aestivum]XP_044433223.1 uncharacterized protein LOC123159447 isoform X2 [Triticum aestivum]XP_044433224.1 uncharacterized protein LOC123159447 isoform X2 [Triticum aestivum]
MQPLHAVQLMQPAGSKPIVLHAGPGGGLRGGVQGEAGGGGEPAAAVRAPGGQRERAAVGVVGLRHGLQAAVLHEGEEVQQGAHRGGGGLARAIAGEGAGVHGRPRRRRRQRRAVQGVGGLDRARVARDITILPMLVINDVQYRGKLERTAVLKAVCAGFKEGTEPQVCLSHDMETNECLHRNGGCWRDEAMNVTACRDTYRGRVCECHVVNSVCYGGDGYTHYKGRLRRHTKFTGHSCGRTKFQLYRNPSRSTVVKDGAPQLFGVMPKEQTMSLSLLFFERPTYHLAAVALEWLHLQMGEVSTCSWEKSRPAPGHARHCHLGPPPTAGAAVPRPFNYATSAVQYILEKKKKQ